MIEVRLGDGKSMNQGLGAKDLVLSPPVLRPSANGQLPTYLCFYSFKTFAIKNE